MLKIENNKKEENKDFNASTISFYKPVGFENSINENNCFVSVIFHALFHFKLLKDNLINIEINKTTPKLIEEIINLLKSYQKFNKEEKDLDKLILNPATFRNELSKVSQNKIQFKENEQGDPIELLNFLFNCLHNFMVKNNDLNKISNSKCENKNCLIHKLFYLNVTEISKCKNCKNETQLKYDYNYFMQLINVDSILMNIKDSKKFNDIKGKMFIYSKIFTTQSNKCEKCNKETIENIIKCDSIGKYFIINLGFDGNFSKMEDLCYLYFMIPREFNVKELYNYKSNNKLYLMGLIIYWSNHYICIFFSPNIEKFIIYDDKNIGYFSSWKELIEKLILNKYQPVALIYGEYEEKHLKKLVNFDLDENFFNNILEIVKVKDIEEKENVPKHLNENEWICQMCTCINNMKDDTCNICGNVNQTITEFNQLKYNELKTKDKNSLSKSDIEFIENYENKNILSALEKWVCNFCGCKTNVIIDEICKMCGKKKIVLKNNDPKVNAYINNNTPQKKNNDHILDHFEESDYLFYDSKNLNNNRLTSTQNDHNDNNNKKNKDNNNKSDNKENNHKNNKNDKNDKSENNKNNNNNNKNDNNNNNNNKNDKNNNNNNKNNNNNNNNNKNDNNNKNNNKNDNNKNDNNKNDKSENNMNEEQILNKNNKNIENQNKIDKKSQNSNNPKTKQNNLNNNQISKDQNAKRIVTKPENAINKNHNNKNNQNNNNKNPNSIRRKSKNEITNNEKKFWFCLCCGIKNQITEKHCTKCFHDKGKKIILCPTCLKNNYIKGTKCIQCNTTVKFTCPICKKEYPIAVKICYDCNKIK